MTITTSIVTGELIEMDWTEAQQDWQDPITTNPCKTPSGPHWMETYLERLQLQEVR
jgi:hypothetical protein